MVVGEPQIIGQVKECYRIACRARSTGKILNRLFHCAFATSKKVHTTTSVSSGRVSVAGVAIELAGQLFADIPSANVVVIGAGEMGQLLVQHLLHAGCKGITVVNRSYERACDVAARYGVEARRWEDLHQQLLSAHIVIASAAVKDYLFTKEAFRKIMGGRREGSLLIIDIAVPRDFDPAINEIEDVYLYSVDDLTQVVEQNRKVREEDITQGMHLITKDVEDFMEWFRARDLGPMIGQMKEKFAEISEHELERFLSGQRRNAPCREVLETMVNRVVNKLSHCVIKNVDAVTRERGPTEAAKFVDSILRQAEEILSKPEDKKDTG
jgi:glutamyl-tRNA reductase